VSEETASKDFVDRAIAAAEKLTDEKFKSRDGAITLLRTEKKDATATYIALAGVALAAFSTILAAVAIAVMLVKH
jgi:hypothetical protein